MDFSKTFSGRNQQLHFARMALYEFLAKHDRVPNYHSEEDAKQLIELAREINERHKKHNEKPEGKKAIVVEEVDEKVMRNVSYYAKCEISPMAALFGEILADTVPEDAKSAVGKDSSRYEHQIAMFGRKW